VNGLSGNLGALRGEHEILKLRAGLRRPLTSEQLLWYKESRQICGFIQRQVLAAFSFYADFLAQNP